MYFLIFSDGTIQSDCWPHGTNRRGVGSWRNGKGAESVCEDKAPTVGKTLDFRTEGFEETGKASSVLTGSNPPILSLTLLFWSQERIGPRKAQPVRQDWLGA